MDTTLTDLARQPLRTVPLMATLREAAVELSEEQVGAVLVADGSGLLGILTELDVVRALADGGEVDDERVRDHMTDQVVSLDEALTAEDAAATMSREGIRHVLVTRGGQPLGMVSARDVVRGRARPAEV